MPHFEFFNENIIDIDKIKEGFNQNLGEACSAWLLKKISNIKPTEKSDDVDSRVFTGMHDFFYKQYKKNYYLPTIVWEKGHPLYKLYIPLRLVEPDNSNIEIRIDENIYNFFTENRKILITDSAGMGKSTISRYISLKLFEQGDLTPIFIELRHITKDKDLTDYIYNLVHPIDFPSNDKTFKKNELLALIKKGGFAFFFDGYDEITNDAKDKLIPQIKDFIAQYSANNFILTSRPEQALGSFPELEVYKINPLEKEESFQLIGKYDDNGERSKRLIEKLKAEHENEINDFLKSPLLVTLLYRSFEYKEVIPLKKSIFYRQVYDALYNWHDLTKEGYDSREKKSKLDSEDFHRVLRGLGFISINKSKIQFSEDEILDAIQNVKKSIVDAKFSASDFLDDILRAVPLFKRDGVQIYWSHKSLADYFCAQYISLDHKNKEKFCISIFKDIFPYANTLEIILEINPDLFHEYFTVPLIKRYQDYVIDIKKSYPAILSNDIEDRAVCTFINEYIFISERSLLTTQVQNKRRDLMEKITQKYGCQRILALTNSDRHIIEKRSSLIITHPFGLILNLLMRRKHQIIKLKALYPHSKSKKWTIPYAGSSSFIHVTDDPSMKWNSVESFKKTTRTLMETQPYILDKIKANDFMVSWESKTNTDLSNL